MSLSEITAKKIMKDGPISFSQFMEMALYFPKLGYYSSHTEKLGRDGDYYTSPCLTPLFGEMIGKQVQEMWALMGEEEFIIVEFGGGNGLLCYDILNFLKNNSKLYNNLHYYIIEKSPSMRDKSKGILHEKVSWYNSINEIGLINGCILSNEVVDNFAVHQVIMKDELMEVFVDFNVEFIEVYKPACKEIKNYLQELNVELPQGFRTEINLHALEWIKEISQALQKGYVLTIDYGYPLSQLYSTSRSNGTLLCYNNHTRNNNPYKNIGKQDITAHVNFSALAHWGLQYGLEFCGFTNQAQFLISLGITQHLKKMEDDGNYTNDNQKKLMSSFLFEMGTKFKVLIQSKGIDKKILTGIQFSQQVF